jgi:hypothetical protein
VSFENCKQIEINKIVYNVIAISDGLVSVHQVGGGGFYTVAIGFLKEIGAKPVYGTPNDGDKIVVWNDPESKYIRVTNGKFDSGCIGTYSEYSDGRLFFDTWENWKPFNLEELEREGNK